MDGCLCLQKCRYQVLTRAGAAWCVRWQNRIRLMPCADADPYGEPQWFRRDDCVGAVK